MSQQFRSAAVYALAAFLPFAIGILAPTTFRPLAAYVFFLLIAVIAHTCGFVTALVCAVSSDASLGFVILNYAEHPLRVQLIRLALFLVASVIVAYTSQQKMRKTHEAERNETARRALFETALDAILLIDSTGHFIDANPAATQLLGMPREEILERKIGSFSPPGMVEAAAADYRRTIEQKRIRGERDIVTANGMIRHVEYASVANLLPGIHCLTLQDITSRKEAEEAVSDLSARLLKVQDEHQRRTARQLHETTAQTLAAIRLNLTRLRRFVGESTDAAETLSDSMTLAEQAISEVRTISYLLHPPLMDDAGLLATLRWYARGFEERSGIKTMIEAPGEMNRLPSSIETTLFRIVQEALTNIQRHSGSDVAEIELRRLQHEVRVEIRDRGHGLPAALRERPELLRRSGVGIAGMYERVRESGGSMSFGSTTAGTTLAVTLPVND
jgi:PAS domain S-box-containing protein